MKIRDEIEKYSCNEDKPILLWLFSKYHWESQWNFVATCSFERYGKLSYQINRKWQPTREGRAIYNQLKDC